MENLIINKIEKTNITVGDDGVEEYDLNISDTYTPKVNVEFSDLNIKLKPTNPRSIYTLNK